MYTITRQQASDILGISTRSIDRYIKSGKIRAEKLGKIVMLSKQDIDNLSGDTPVKQKIIIEKKVVENKNENLDINLLKKEAKSTQVIKRSDYERILNTFEKMYDGFRQEVKQKDEKIQELSMEVGSLREQKKNSIDIMEYKKEQFLAEENKKNLAEKIKEEKKKQEKILKDLKYEKTTNRLLIFFLVTLFIVSTIIFFISI